jgi:hypothetical protein
LRHRNPDGGNNSTETQHRNVTKKGNRPMDLKLILDELQALRGELHGLRDDLRHYQGFVGGVAWLMGGVAAAAGVLVSWLKEGA